MKPSKEQALAYSNQNLKWYKKNNCEIIKYYHLKLIQEL